MAPSKRPAFDVELEKEAVANKAAADLLQHFLNGQFLPDYLPEEPRGLAAAMGVTNVAPDLFWALSRLYGVDKWDYEKFLTHIVAGAIPAWKTDSQVVFGKDAVHIKSSECPLRARAENDPRVCDMCRLMHETLARFAARGRIESVTVETRSPATGCEVVIREKSPGNLRDEDRPSPARSNANEGGTA